MQLQDSTERCRLSSNCSKVGITGVTAKQKRPIARAPLPTYYIRKDIVHPMRVLCYNKSIEKVTGVG